jgi:hypothetical protein
MVMLGGNLQVTAPDKPLSPEVPEEDQVGPPLASKVKAWMRSHGITREQLSEVFHLDGGTCEVLPSEAPGKNGKEKTINAYVLTGVSAFLQTGETSSTTRPRATSARRWAASMRATTPTI